MIRVFPEEITVLMEECDINEALISRLAPGIRNYPGIFSIAGINISGKSTITHLLEDAFDPLRIQLYTSRPPRKGKGLGYLAERERIIDPRTYYFRTKEYLESIYDGAVIFRRKKDHLYAITKDEIEDKVAEAIRARKIVLIPGVFVTPLTLKTHLFPNMFIIYLEVPEEDLRERFLHVAQEERSGQALSEEEAMQRVAYLIREVKIYNELAQALHPLVIDFLAENRNYKLMHTVKRIETKVRQRLSRIRWTDEGGYKFKGIHFTMQ